MEYPKTFTYQYQDDSIKFSMIYKFIRVNYCIIKVSMNSQHSNFMKTLKSRLDFNDFMNPNNFIFSSKNRVEFFITTLLNTDIFVNQETDIMTLINKMIQ